MLSGIKHDQTEASFYNQYLHPADGILIASDLRVTAVLKKLDVQLNDLGRAGEQALRDAAKGRDGFELLL